MNGSSYQTINGRLQQNGPSNPVLVLEPVNDTFVMKSLELPDQTKVKIGRQTGVTTAPHPSNGFFDSKVLSRVHAEVWSESGKVYIRDLKSSNGTFLNGKRLCAENTESEPFELSQGDNLEFGIDILDENGALLHEKVSCKIYLSRKNMLTSGTAPQDSIAKQKLTSTPGPGVYSTKTHSTSTAASAAAAAAAVATPGGLSENIDLILSRLQNELTRSQETYADLGFLKHGLHELEKVFVVTTNIQDTNNATSSTIAEPEEMKDHSSGPKLNGGGQPAANTTASASSPSSSSPSSSSPPPQANHPPFQIATGSSNDHDRSQEHAHLQEISRLTIALEEVTAELGNSIERIQTLERQLNEERQVFEEEQQNHFQQQLEADRTRERLDQLTAELDQVSQRHRTELETAVTELEATHKEHVDRLVLEADQEHETLAKELRNVHTEELEKLESLRVEETRVLEKELREVKQQLQNSQKESQQHQHPQQLQHQQPREQEQQDIPATRDDRDSIPESHEEHLAQMAAVRKELARAHKEIQELKKDRQGWKPHLQEEDYSSNGNGHGNGHHNTNGDSNGSLETLTPNSTTSEEGQDTAKSKSISSEGASDVGAATAAWVQDTSRSEGDTGQEFSWTQFAFPMDKRNQAFISQPPSTMLLSGVFLLIGLGVYALWHKAGMPGY
ncbi:hypothetical protein EMPS_07611 [Entomortierella parvispora]|uniref:FHA domain-containing protein n=1 Tax=Entomortierella parvispora TaxID=205924 RepID=A0A9P3HEV5_9FUNG|nr:hypothetical protein EMPS_07611 [Entomortierella parvispora]